MTLPPQKRAVITGFGVVSPLGNEKDLFFNRLCQGESGLAPITSFDATFFRSSIAGEVKDLNLEKYLSKKKIRRTDKFTQFALAASHMAYEDAHLSSASVNPLRFGVIIGSGMGGIKTIESTVIQFYKNELTRKGLGASRVSPFFIPKLIANIAGGEVAIQFNCKGPNFCVVTACASGTHAIGEAYRSIQRGEADLFLTGGTEAAITELSLGGFDSLTALSTKYNDNPTIASRPFDGLRDGFVMAEGAGIIVLEEYESALKRGARIYAELIGYGLSDDAHHITSPDPMAEGAVQCISLALKDANVDPSEVDYINAHGTSTILNDKTETLAVKRVYGDHAYNIPISSMKSMTGHMLGASGAVEIGATSMMLTKQVITPTINHECPDPECDLDYVPNKLRKHSMNIAVSQSFGFGGHNACVVLKKFDS